MTLHPLRHSSVGRCDPHDDGDGATTTGTGPSEEFVGRVAGDDGGEDRESGAEARAPGSRTQK